jgi:hypothetical protein
VLNLLKTSSKSVTQGLAYTHANDSNLECPGGQINASNSTRTLSSLRYRSRIRIHVFTKTNLELLICNATRARHVSPRRRKSCVSSVESRERTWMKTHDPRKERESLARGAERVNRNVMVFPFARTARMRRSSVFSPHQQLRSTTG